MTNLTLSGRVIKAKFIKEGQAFYMVMVFNQYNLAHKRSKYDNTIEIFVYDEKLLKNVCPTIKKDHQLIVNGELYTKFFDDYLAEERTKPYVIPNKIEFIGRTR